MKNSHESIIWIKDEDGDNHVCYINDDIDENRRFEQLSKDEKQHCYTEKLPWS